MPQCDTETWVGVGEELVGKMCWGGGGGGISRQNVLGWGVGEELVGKHKWVISPGHVMDVVTGQTVQVQYLVILQHCLYVDSIRLRNIFC